MKAFPSNHDPKTGTMQLGMELRDYFAAMALQGLLVDDGWDVDYVAKKSYELADAMMKAREQ